MNLNNKTIRILSVYVLIVLCLSGTFLFGTFGNTAFPATGKSGAYTLFNPHATPQFSFNPVTSCQPIDLTTLVPATGSIDGLTMEYLDDTSQPLSDPTAVSAGTYLIRGTDTDLSTYTATVVVANTRNENPVTGVLYVKTIPSGNRSGSSWDNAFDGTNLAWYLREKAQNGTVIYVAEGTYLPYLPGCDIPSDPRGYSFELTKQVKMYGGFPANATGTTTNNSDPKTYITRLSGEIGDTTDNTDNSYVVVKITAATGTLIDGFYISDGYGYGTNGAGVSGSNLQVITLSNVVVENNETEQVGTTGSQGAGIYSSKEVILTNVTVTNNRSTNSGGGIYASALTLDNTTIENNTSVGIGGGLAINGSLTLKNDVVIDNNKTTGGSGHGGGMYFSGKTINTTALKSLKITNSKGINGGGICFQSNADVTIDGSYGSIVISDNSASRGGAIQANTTTNLKLIKVTLSNNKASVTGGGILTAAPLDIQNSTIQNNTATSNGGGIHSSGTVKFNQVDVLDNTSLNGSGGGLFITTASSNLISNNSTISRNSAKDGGGILMEGWMQANTTNMYGNKVSGSGGAISASGILNLEGMTLQNNKAGGSGGAIYSTGQLLLSGNCFIENNKAGGSGGGICLKPAVTGNAFIGDAVNMISLSGNTSGGNGGGFCFDPVATTAQLFMDGVSLSGDTAKIGGGIYSARGIVNLSGTVKISSNVATDGTGGGIHSNETLNVNGDVTVENNKATGNGGGIHSAGALALKGKIVMNNNSSGGNGGGLSVNAAFNADNTTLLRINNNTSAIDGGGVWFNTNGTTIKLGKSGVITSISGNTSGNHGGGLYTSNTLVLENTSLKGNAARNYGGAVYTTAATALTLKNDSVSNNKAGYNSTTDTYTAGNGGGIYAQNALTLEGNMVIEDNTAGGYGGGLHIDNGGSFPFNTGSLNSITVTGNTSRTNNGGGICSEAGFTINTPVRSTFAGNRAAIDGGAVSSSKALSFTNTTFTNNTTGEDGGAIRTTETLSLKDATFTGNKAGYNNTTDTYTTGYGGGVYLANTAITLSGTIRFENNAAASIGGGIYATTYTTNDLTSFTVSQNKAVKGSGGGLYVGSSLTLTAANNAVFSGNTAKTNGGAIHANNSLSLASVSLSDNKADASGGAIYKVSTGKMDIAGSTFSNNTAANGGAIHTAANTLADANTIVNSTFSRNSAISGSGGAIHSAGSGSAESLVIMLSTFNGNTATGAGPAIHYVNSGGKILNGNLIYGNGTGSEVNNAAALTANYNVIRGNALSGYTNINLASGLGSDVFTNVASDIAVLENNGGTTLTLNIKEKGYAHNVIPPVALASWGTFTNDQRGNLRTIGCQTDAGAVEINAVDESGTYSLKPGTAAVCFNSLLDPDTLIVSTTGIVDTVYYSDKLYTQRYTAKPILITTQSKIYVKFVSPSNCEYFDSIALSVRPIALAADITANAVSVCSGTSATLSAQPAVAGTIDNPVFRWYAGQNTTTVLYTGASYSLGIRTAAVTTSTPYFVSVSGDNRCENAQGTRKEVQLTVLQAPTINIETQQDTTGGICHNANITLDAVTTGTINWIGWYDSNGQANNNTQFAPSSLSHLVEYNPTPSEAGKKIKLLVRANAGACGYVRDSVYIRILPMPTVAGLELVTEPQVFQDMCVDTLYEVKVKAMDLGGLANMTVKLHDINGTGMAIKSAYIKQPYTATSWVALTETVADATGKTWKLPDVLEHGDSALIRVFVAAECGFFSGSSVNFNLNATSVCGDLLPEHTITTGKFNTKQDLSQLNTYDITSSFNINKVTNATNDTVTWRLQAVVHGNQPTDDQKETMVVLIPAGLNVVPESYKPVRNAPTDRSSLSMNTDAFGTKFGIPVKSGLYADSVIIVELKFHATNSPCGIYDFTGEIIFADSVICGGNKCTFNSSRGSVTPSLEVERYRFSLADVVYGKNVEDMWFGNIKVKAETPFYAGQPIHIDFYADLDGNSSLTAADVKVKTFTHITEDVAQGSVFTVEFDSVRFEPTKQLLAVVSGNALCGSATIPVATLAGTDTLCKMNTTYYRTATGMETYKWNVIIPDGISGATPVRIPLEGSTTANYINESTARIVWRKEGNYTVWAQYSLPTSPPHEISRTLFDVRVNELPVVALAAAADTAVCEGGKVKLSRFFNITSSSAATLSFFKKETDGTYTFLSNQSTYYAEPTATTIYGAIATSDAGCDSGEPVDFLVNVNKMPQTNSISVVQQPTCTTATGSIQITVSGGSGSYEYNFDNGAVYYNLPANGIIENLPVDDYRLYIKDKILRGCAPSISPSVSLSASEIGLGVAAQTTDASNCSSNNGKIQLTIMGGAVPYRYKVNGSSFANMPADGVIGNNFAVGTYNVTVADKNNCIVTAGDVRIEPTSGLVLNLTQTTPAACAENGTVQVALAGGTPAYSYRLSGQGWTPMNGSATNINVGAGLHKVYAKDANGCETSDTLRMANNVGLSATVARINHATCDGTGDGSIRLNIRGSATPLTYSLDGGQTKQPATAGAFTIPSLSAGTYRILIIDGNGCTFSLEEITINKIFGFIQAADNYLYTYINQPVTGNMAADDYEYNRLPVKVISNTSPSHGSVVVSPNGTFTYTPTTGFIGNDSVQYTVVNPCNLRSTAWAHIKVLNPSTALNRQPVASDDVFRVKTGTSLIGFNVSTNDIDPAGGVLTAPVVTSGVQRGTLTPRGNGIFDYTPDANFAGADMFTYSTCEPDGTCSSARALIVVWSDDVYNNSAVAMPEAYTVARYDKLTITAPSAGILANDSYPLGGTPAITVTTAPAHGTLAMNANGTFEYTPNKKYYGPDGFAYRLCAGAPVRCDSTWVDLFVTERDCPVPVSFDFANVTNCRQVDIKNMTPTSGSIAGLTLTYWNNDYTTDITATANAITQSGIYHIIGENTTGCVDTASVVVTVNAALNGDYTLGNVVGADFPTLKAAADRYNSCGIVGNSRLIVVSDLPETSMVEFLGTAPGSDTYRLTITSDNTVKHTVSGAVNGALIKFTAANNIVINGLVPATEANQAAPLLAFANTYTATASATVRALDVMPVGTNNGKGIRVYNAEFSTAQKTELGCAAINFGTDTIVVESCFLHGAYYGINSASSVKNARIRNNVMTEMQFLGVNLTAANGHIYVTDNVVRDMVSNARSWVYMGAINIYNTGAIGATDVLNNKAYRITNQNSSEGPTTIIKIYSIQPVRCNGNVISDITSMSTSVGFALQGISIQTGSNGTVEMLNDTLRNFNSQSFIAGIYVSSPVSASVTSNIKNCSISNFNAKIVRFDQSSCLGIYATGTLNIEACTITGLSNPVGAVTGIHAASGVKAVNNCMISDIKGVVGTGIYATGVAGLYHNTVRLTGKLDDSHEATAVYLGDRFGTATLNVALRNNILSNEITTGPDKNFVLKKQSNTNFTAISDNRYNAVNGNIAMVVTDKTAQTGTVYPTLANWKAVTAADNSTVFQPQFVSNSDLHLAAVPLNGTPLLVPLIAGVNTDFDGDARFLCNNAAGADNNLSIPEPVTGTLFVKTLPAGTGDGSSWDNAYDGLRLAKFLREKAVDGTKVYVAAGTYLPYLEGCDNVITYRELSFDLVKSVEVTGGYSALATGTDLSSYAPTTNITRLSGELQGDANTGNNSYSVVYIANASALLKGFYVSGGNSNGSTTIFANGGGIFSSTAATLEDIVVADNSAKTQGGGIYATGTLTLQGTVVIDGNKVGTNGGGIYVNADINTSRAVSLYVTNNTAVNGAGIFIAKTDASNNIKIGDQGITTNISGNTVTGAGGGIYFESKAESAFTLQNATLSNNTSLGSGAGNNGGAIWLKSGGGVLTVILKNDTFSNNKAGFKSDGTWAANGSGGGIQVDAGTVNMDLQGTVIFDGNRSGYAGAALCYNTASGNITGDNTRLTLLKMTNNIATNNAGGAIYVGNAGTPLSLYAQDSVVFRNNVTKASGGGIYAAGQVTLGNAAVSNNKAGYDVATNKYVAGTNRGGGVYANTLTLMGNAVFKNNTVGGSAYSNGGGGAIYANSGINGSSLSSLLIDSNAAVMAAGITVGPLFGGGIYNNANSVTLTVSGIVPASISNNLAVGNGGGIYTAGALTLGNTTISNNKAGYDVATRKYLTAGDGGGIYATNALTLQGTLVFENDTAAVNAGAIYGGTSLNTNALVSLSIKDCRADALGTTLGKGGGIYLTSGTSSLGQNGTVSVTGCTAYQGGGIYTAVNLTLQNATVSNNTARGTGGGIFVDKVKLTLTDGTVSGNRSGWNYNTSAWTSGNGGGISIENTSASLELKGSVVLENNTSGSSGGAIYYSQLNNNFITSALTSLTIRGNESKAMGGGIYNVGALTLNAPNSPYIISNNKAGNNGGGIYTTTAITVQNTTMKGNMAKYNGGAISMVGGTLTVADDTISNNRSGWDYDNSVYVNGGGRGNGGGVSVENANGVLSMKGKMVFENNTAGNVGGAIVLNNGINGAIDGTGLTSLVVRSNESKVAGGGIYTLGLLTLNAPNSPFLIVNNKAGNNGGGIYIANVALNLSKIRLIGNSSTAGEGGGIYFAGITTSASITNSTMKGNTAFSSGGAISANRSSGTTEITLTLANDTISDNTAARGGGVSAQMGLAMQGSLVFENNTATTENGGALLKSIMGNFTTSALASLVVNNNQAAALGGGIYTQAPMTLTAANKAVFSNNNATTDGGAIYAANALTMDAVSLLNNTAIRNGGGIYKTASTAMTVTASTFAVNKAILGGGVYTESNSTTDVSTIGNSTFSGNSASATGGAVYSVGTGSTAALNITLSTFNGNTTGSNNGQAIYFVNAANRKLNGNIFYDSSSGTEIMAGSGLTSISATYNMVRGLLLNGTGNRNIDSGEAANVFVSVTGDIADLASNGGPTQTLAIKTGGLAHNMIPSATAAAWGTYPNDQRGAGYNRSFGCKTDAGSFEIQTPDIPVILAITGPSEVCTNDRITYGANPGMKTYQWELLSGGVIDGSSTAATSTIVWGTTASPPLYNVKVTVTDNSNCDYNVTLPVTVKVRSYTGPMYRVPNKRE